MTYTERVAIDCIDTFENFLEDRGVRVPSSDEQMKAENVPEWNTARIYGDDYGELQERLADDIEHSTQRITECVFDLTLIFAEFIRESDIDSREMFLMIHDLALEFENHYLTWEFDGHLDAEDYMTAIEQFGERKLAELKEEYHEENNQR